MDQTTENTPVESSSDAGRLSAGDRLREAREARDLELRDVAAKTRQSQDTLIALEAMKTDHIPATILRMQAKMYARFLELPEEEIAADYAETRGTTNAEAMPNEVVRADQGQRPVFLIGGGLAAVLAVGVLALIFAPGSKPDVEELAVSARIAPVQNELVDPIATLNESAEELSIRTQRAAWIEVRGSDGTVFRSRQMAANETYFPRTGAGWTVTVRDAGAFQWRIGDYAFAAFGPDEQALYSLSIDKAMEEGQAAQTAALADVQTSTGQRR